MEISSGAFRRNVRKTFNVKAVKLGLRTVAHSNQRTQLSNLVVALKVDVGNVVQALNQYVLGFQLKPEMKDAAFLSMGEVGYDLVGLSALLKVKLPSSTKKTKLVGTRTAALLQLDSLATDLLTMVATGMFASPVMKRVSKEVTIPTDGSKEMREVSVLDEEADIAAELEREDAIKGSLATAIEVFWKLAYDLFQAPPEVLFSAKMARLQEQYPELEFDLTPDPEEVPATAPVPAETQNA